MIKLSFPTAQFILLQATEALAPLIKKHVGSAPVIIATENLTIYECVDLLILCSGTAAHEAR